MMSILVTLASNRTAEAVMLAVHENSMRIVLPGAEDTVELTRANGVWFAEDNTPVSLEALLTDGETDVSEFTHLTPRVMVAGRA